MIKIKLASVDSIIIYFGDEITKEISQKVKSTYLFIKALNNKAFIEIIPSYSSIFIKYDIFQYSFDSIKNYLSENLNNIDKELFEDSFKLINIDVYYGTDVGLDLQRVSNSANISIDELISIHSSKVYDVYAIGFLPGFAYLASVDEKISLPRLKTPRKKIPKGSVAIADLQTAVYPCDSPGGWNIIGKTAFNFFDKNLENLSEIDINSKIKFNPITKKEFLKQGGKIEF